MHPCMLCLHPHASTSTFFFFNDTATTEIYTLSYTTLFRSRRREGFRPACGRQRSVLGHGRPAVAQDGSLASARGPEALSASRSEERRVGKSVDLGGRRIIKKKKSRGGGMRV